MPDTSRFVNVVLTCVVVTQPRSPEPITLDVGKRVAEHRKAAGLSQSELAERVADHGPDWGRTTVAKLESGGRKAVTVQELLALALVFDVPPVSLIADPRQTGTVPISNTIEADHWTALAWLVGNGTLDGRVGHTYGHMHNVIAAGNRIIEAGRRLLTKERGYLSNDDGTLAHTPDGALIPDEDEARRLTDTVHRVALEEIRSELLRLRSWNVPAPDLTGSVVRRAAELGVDLPGVDA